MRLKNPESFSRTVSSRLIDLVKSLKRIHVLVPKLREQWHIPITIG